MQLERLLLNIETLVTRSRNIEEIDAHVTVAILHHRRWHLQSTLRENIELVLQSGERTMTTFNLPANNVLVHSMYRRWFRGGKHRKGYLPTTINSNPLWLSKVNNFEILKKMDTPQVRILYLDEFRERCQILLEAVEKGELDDLFGTLPFEILHRIIGLYGELLPRLDIDPMKSRIHKVGKYQIIEIVYEDQADSEAPARP